MSKQYELDFEQYIKQGEPDKSRNCMAWQTAMGLQAVDGLKPSEMLKEMAARNIEGELSIDEVRKLVDSYYENKNLRTEDDASEEADKVSVNIRNLLESKTFTFSVAELIGIHRQLFKGVFMHAGTIRTYNISKREWILDGESVVYADHEMIMETLEYDFEKEKSFNYIGLAPHEMIKHFSRFVSNIWQIHPFREGNTRTTAVFAIKYLNALGFDVSNDAFIDNSWYFRNALVRANYSNVKRKISFNTEYLEKFFCNLLLGENNELRNRHLHVNASLLAENLPVNNDNLPVKIENLPVKKTCKALLLLLIENPSITYDELAMRIKKTRETVRVNLRKLEGMGFVRRVGSDKNGHWEVLFSK